MTDAKSNYLENGIIGLVFNATSVLNLAQDSSGGGATNLIVALHTADPGEAGTQNTNEATYTSYTRIKVERTSSGFTVAGGTATLTTVQAFPQATGGSETLTHASISLSTASTADVLYYGALSTSIAVSNGVTPRLTTSFTISET